MAPKRKRVEKKITEEEQQLKLNDETTTTEQNQTNTNKEEKQDVTMKIEVNNPLSTPTTSATLAPTAAEEEEKKEQSEPTEEESNISSTTDMIPTNTLSKSDKKKLALASSSALATLPMSLDDISFIITGKVNRSKVEGYILEYGGSISKTILKKHQYVIEGPGVTNEFGGYSGPGTVIYKEAKKKKKTFMSENDFMNWINQIKEYKLKEEEELLEFDNEINNIIKLTTDIFEDGINLIIEYATDEFPIVGHYRDWLKLESATGLTSNLPPPATEEEISKVETELEIRLPLWLKQLLRIHNGNTYYTTDNIINQIVIFPSTNQMLATNKALTTSFKHVANVLRWIPIYCYATSGNWGYYPRTLFVVPESLGNTVISDGDNVVAESLEDILKQYVKIWNENISKNSNENIENDITAKAKLYSDSRPLVNSLLISKPLKDYNHKLSKQKQLVLDRLDPRSAAWRNFRPEFDGDWPGRKRYKTKIIYTPGYD